jgi:PKD repeat protein
VTHTVTVSAANQPPVAAFTSTVSGLTVNVDGSTSSDPDGSIASYAWDFGDSATGTGATATHTYAAAGTYQVKLTVTDNHGATDSVTHAVTVAAAGVVAQDSFSRTTSNGWGSADVGGAWSVTPANLFSDNGTTGLASMATASSGPTAMLNSVSAQNVNVLLDASVDKVPNGNGSLVAVIVRHAGSSDYRFKLRFMPDGTVHLAISKVVAGAETTLQEVGVSGLTYTGGTTLRMRFQATGNGTTTLVGKVWLANAAEPAGNQISLTDTEATLQAPGSVGLQSYLSGSTTNAPVVTSFNNFSVASN